MNLLLKEQAAAYEKAKLDFLLDLKRKMIKIPFNESRAFSGIYFALLDYDGKGVIPVGIKSNFNQVIVCIECPEAFLENYITCLNTTLYNSVDENMECELIKKNFTNLANNDCDIYYRFNYNGWFNVQRNCFRKRFKQ
jgi:hypothetical protein